MDAREVTRTPSASYDTHDWLISQTDKNRPFAVWGHVTTATLNRSAMTKWNPEMERAG